MPIINAHAKGARRKNKDAPTSGNKPMAVSGIAIFISDEITILSDKRATPRPPPITTPSTSDVTGFGKLAKHISRPYSALK